MSRRFVVLTALGMRTYPELADLGISCRPLSIVCVHFSDEVVHNFARSECLRRPENQVIVVDNRDNAHFVNLGEALNAGIRDAVHPVVVAVHEDVLLPVHWQQHFERALRALETADPKWGLLGAVGWREDGSVAGHWSDPNGHRNTLGEDSYRRVDWLDEQVLVFKNDGVIRPDPDLPSIHNIGRDLAASARLHGRKAYAINAPTIHKYADAQGRLIQSREESPKIRDRRQIAYRADAACSNEYFVRKWSRSPTTDTGPSPVLAKEQEDILAAPLVLVARGGGGSRLLSTMAQDFAVFIGGRLNRSGDAVELVMPIYKGVIRKFSCRAAWQKEMTTPDLRLAAMRMLEKADWPERWGFKLPESIYLIPEVREAFPRARFLHLVRDPLSTCLRRTHMTGRLDNQIGRAVIPAGYDHVGRPRLLIHTDSVPMRMAVTTTHQMDLAFDHLPEERTHVVKFESLLDSPETVLAELSVWLGEAAVNRVLTSAVDRARAEFPAVAYAPTARREVEEFLLPLRRTLGYAAPTQ